MPAIFGDHMVLQEEATLPVWGTADPGEKITVALGNQVVPATAGDDGKWTALLQPLPAGATVSSLLVTGKNNAVLRPVQHGI